MRHRGAKSLVEGHTATRCSVSVHCPSASLGNKKKRKLHHLSQPPFRVGAEVCETWLSQVCWGILPSALLSTGVSRRPLGQHNRCAIKISLSVCVSCYDPTPHTPALGGRSLYALLFNVTLTVWYSPYFLEAKPCSWLILSPPRLLPYLPHLQNGLGSTPVSFSPHVQPSSWELLRLM